jgi:RNA polymerase sigma factor (sigma-70 family)
LKKNYFFIDYINLNFYTKFMLEAVDKNLIVRILQGETKAETELLQKYGPLIARKVSFDLGAGNADWRDVAADAQLALLISLRDGKFDIDRGTSLGSYVYGITINKIRDYFKTQKTRPLVKESLPECIVSAAETYDLERKEIRSKLRTLLGKLKIKYQEVLYMRYYEELSITEISEKINLSPRRVSERIHYAITLLRKECHGKGQFSIFFSFILILY